LLTVGVLVFGRNIRSGRAENWPGYEGGNVHHNASAVSIPPVNLTVVWDRTLGPPQDCYADRPGFFGSRNLTLVDGYLAVVGVPDSFGYPGVRAYVTVLNATNGAVVNCIRTAQYHGPHVGQTTVTNNQMEAYDTGIGITWTHWDPQTKILFLRNGGNGANHTAYLPLANASNYAGSGTYQSGKGAWEDFYATHPLHEDQAGLKRADKRTPTYAYPGGPDCLLPDNWDYCNGAGNSVFLNQAGFFDVDDDGDWILAVNSSAAAMAAGFSLINKYTGVRGCHYAGAIAGRESLIEPPPYVDPKPLFLRAFKMWGGSMLGNGRLFFIGPGDVGDATATSPGDSDLGGEDGSSIPDQGLYILSCHMQTRNYRPDEGYEGPGADETVLIGPTAFNYRVSSLHLPVSGWDDAESYFEYDGFYRNKAWLVDGTGVWVAWKPCRTANVELLHCDEDGMQRYDLRVGAGMRGQDIWPHISLVVFDGVKYIVYYHGNAWYRPLDPQNQWAFSPTVTNPLGSAEFAVFDATERELIYTFELNNPARTGYCPTLPPNEAEGYFDRSQMLVAGRYAYVAWLDCSGTTSSNVLLRFAVFDITGRRRIPVLTPPYDLRVPAEENRASCVFDLAAADGTLYALITLADNLCATNHTWSRQRIVAVRSLTVPPEEPTARVLHPVADTWVDGDPGNSRMDVNFGADPTLHIYGQAGDTPREGAVSDILIRFDLSTLSPGTVISNAVLRLFWRDTHPERGTIVYVLGANKPWTEGDGTPGSGATFITYDGANTWLGGNINAVAGNYDWDFTAYQIRMPTQSWENTYVEFDVTPLVEAWVNGGRPNYGFVVVNNARVPDPDFNNMTNFPPSEYNVDSREGPNPPELKLLYIPAPELDFGSGAVLIIK